MTLMKVFVSHSHEDDDFGHALVKALREAGADIWYDSHDLRTGQIMDTVERELRHRPIFVLILTLAALRSSWVLDECKWAYALLRYNPTRLILPVLASAGIEQSQLPLYLQDFRRVEAPGMRPYPQEQAVWLTLRALSLPSIGEAPTPVPTPQFPEDIGELLAQGKALFAQHQFAAALSFFERATQRYPRNLEAWVNLGHGHASLKRYTNALYAFEQATNLDANNTSGWTSKADVLNELGRYQEALRACERATTLDPNNAFAWIIRGYALNSLKRYKEALTACERATTLDPNNAFAWENKAFTLRALGRAADAGAAEQQARELR